MNEELVKALDESDYIQIGTLEAIYVNPHQTPYSWATDVNIQIVRSIPRYPVGMVPKELDKACTDYFRWFIKAKWDDLLEGKDVLLSKGFGRDSNSILGASYIVDLPVGRKFSIPLKKDWDITQLLHLLPKKLRADSWYRFTTDHWEVCMWVEEGRSAMPGNLWDAKAGEILEEKSWRIGRWTELPF